MIPATTQRQLYHKIFELIKETCPEQVQEFSESAILSFLINSNFFELLLLIKAKELAKNSNFPDIKPPKAKITRPIMNELTDFPIEYASHNYSLHINSREIPDDYLDSHSKWIAIEYCDLSESTLTLLTTTLNAHYHAVNPIHGSATHIHPPSIIKIRLDMLLNKIVPDSKNIIAHLFKNIATISFYLKKMRKKNVVQNVFWYTQKSHQPKLLAIAWKTHIEKCIKQSSNIEAFLKTYFPSPVIPGQTKPKTTHRKRKRQFSHSPTSLFKTQKTTADSTPNSTLASQTPEQLSFSNQPKNPHDYIITAADREVAALLQGKKI